MNIERAVAAPVLAATLLTQALQAQSSRPDASLAVVLFQGAQAEATANTIVPGTPPKAYFDWSPSPKQSDVTLGQLEKLMLGSPHADARTSAVQLFDGGCRAVASSGTVPCVTGDSIVAGRMGGETYRGMFQVQLVATLQRIGEHTADTAVRAQVVELLIGTMRLVRAGVPGCNNASCEYLSAQKAAGALGAIHRALAPRRGDAHAPALMLRIAQALRGSAAAETVPPLKLKMERTLAELQGPDP